MRRKNPCVPFLAMRLWCIGLEQGKFDQATDYLQNSLRIARDLNDYDMLAYSLAHLVYISHYQGRYQDAEVCGEESDEFVKRSGDAIAQAISDTHRDSRIVLEEVKTISSNDFEARLEWRRNPEVKDGVLKALGG